MRIYDEMERMKRRLSDDPETRDRYERATRGGREWLAFSAWIDEDGSRWTDAGVIRYRDMLADWLVLTDIAYVLQFETNPLTIAFLKDRLLPTAKRETMPERIDRKRRKLDMGLHRSFLRGTSVYGLSRQGSCCGDLGGNMQKSAMKEVAAYLMGCSHGAAHWAHPDSGRYNAWYNSLSTFETDDLSPRGAL